MDGYIIAVINIIGLGVIVRLLCKHPKRTESKLLTWQDATAISRAISIGDRLRSGEAIPMEMELRPKHMLEEYRL